MPDHFEYIDSYFNKELNAEENKVFERQILNDPVFAEQVAEYCSIMNAAANVSGVEKTENFRNIFNQNKPEQQPARVKRLWLYASAAAIAAVVLLVWNIFSGPTAPDQVATVYITQNLQTLGINMGSSPDSIQTGLKLYNEGKLNEALQVFDNILQHDAGRWEAKKYAGITCLRLQQYDQAVVYFGQLEAQEGLFSNPGYFYHALTLLKRDSPGDADRARQILREVVKDNREGKQDAEELLKKF